MRPTSRGMAPVGSPTPLICKRPLTLNAAEARAANDQRRREQDQQAHWVQRLADADDLDEIASVLEAGADVVGEGFARLKWRRLLEQGALGPPSHDIVTARCHWTDWGKPQRLTFEELSRQPAWFGPDAQPFCLREGLSSPMKETRGRMDVWFARDGRTFRREVIYRPKSGTSRSAHDARLTWEWTNETRSVERAVAVPVGEPPCTREEKGFLRPPRTTALRNTILLTHEGSVRGHLLEHDLARALAAAIRNRSARAKRDSATTE